MEREWNYKYGKDVLVSHAYLHVGVTAMLLSNLHRSYGSHKKGLSDIDVKCFVFLAVGWVDWNVKQV